LLGSVFQPTRRRLHHVLQLLPHRTPAARRKPSRPASLRQDWGSSRRVSAEVVASFWCGRQSRFRCSAGTPPTPCTLFVQAPCNECNECTQCTESTHALVLGQQLLDHPRWLHPCELLVQALVTVGEALVIEAEQVQDRRVVVTDV